MVSTLTEVTSQFLSAAVSRTFCSTDKPERRRVTEKDTEEVIQTDGEVNDETIRWLTIRCRTVFD